MGGAGEPDPCQPLCQLQRWGTGPTSCSVTALSVGHLPPPNPGIVPSGTKNAAALEQEAQREIQGRQSHLCRSPLCVFIHQALPWPAASRGQQPCLHFTEPPATPQPLREALSSLQNHRPGPGLQITPREHPHQGTAAGACLGVLGRSSSLRMPGWSSSLGTQQLS